MTASLTFACEIAAGDAPRTEVHTVAPRQFVIAGWTGRDAQAIEHHIHELQLVGVPAPSAVPLYYRASASLLTQDDSIQVLGTDSSGEAEPVLFFSNGQWWLTVGSDHTDRKVEGYSVAVSKQMCAKPVAAAAWRWADVAGYQDELELRSRIVEDGQWVDYQRGSFASIRPLASLLEGAAAGVKAEGAAAGVKAQGAAAGVKAQGAAAGVKAEGAAAGALATDGSFVCCGTLGALKNALGAGIRPAAQMELEIRDPRRQRSIVHRYAVQTLPVVA